MAQSNDWRIAQALNTLQKCLRLFVEERMRSEYKDRWLEKARLSLPNLREQATGVNLDVQALIRIATDKQHRVLYEAFSPHQRNLLHELREVRNRHAHQNPFDERDVERALDTLELLLESIGSPEAAEIAGLRKQPERATRVVPVMLRRASQEKPALKSAQLRVGAAGLDRGVRLFQHLAQQANRGKPLGIGYADFIAFLHGKGSFQEVAGRNYLPGDSGIAIELAWAITHKSGGRIDVAANGQRIASGMDTYIWASSFPYDRPERAFNNPKCRLPYSREAWKLVFPDGKRRMITQSELAAPGRSQS